MKNTNGLYPSKLHDNANALPRLGLQWHSNALWSNSSGQQINQHKITKSAESLQQQGWAPQGPGHSITRVINS